jgi:hypothetical protein
MSAGFQSNDFARIVVPDPQGRLRVGQVVAIATLGGFGLKAGQVAIRDLGSAGGHLLGFIAEDQLAPAMVCGMCRGGGLEEADAGVRCDACGRRLLGYIAAPRPPFVGSGLSRFDTRRAATTEATTMGDGSTVWPVWSDPAGS